MSNVYINLFYFFIALLEKIRLSFNISKLIIGMLIIIIILNLNN